MTLILFAFKIFVTFQFISDLVKTYLCEQRTLGDISKIYMKNKLNYMKLYLYLALILGVFCFFFVWRMTELNRVTRTFPLSNILIIPKCLYFDGPGLFYWKLCRCIFFGNICLPKGPKFYAAIDNRPEQTLTTP